MNVIVSTVAMYTLDAFQKQVEDGVNEHQPRLKLYCVKVALFLPTYQAVGALFFCRGHR